MAKPASESKEAELLRLWISVNHQAIDAYVERIVGELRGAIVKSITEELAAVRASQSPEPFTAASKVPEAGVQLNEEERMKAADLRTALLLGKVPEDAGLLIDVKTAARLLNVSPRTLYLLNSILATSDPIRICRLVLFRLTELLAWIEADCPPKKHWSYSPNAPQTKRRK